MNEIKDIKQKYHIHRLNEDELVNAFDCGDLDLNDFIINEARPFRRALLSVTYVLAERDNPNNVVGFCSLANDRISLSDFENKTDFNRFRRQKRFPQSKRMKSYPAVKLCRLAVDKKARGISAGTFLLDFIKSYFINDNKTGCRFITVDAYLPAIPFYEKNGFVPLNTDDEDATYTRLLYFDLNDLVPSVE